MNWKQFLTEKVLHEPEATSEYTVANNGDLVSVKTVIKNHTFDNDADMMALFRKMVDNGKWFSCENSFWDYAFFVWRADRDNDQRDYSAWLFYDPSRFCCLVAQWLEGKENL